MVLLGYVLFDAGDRECIIVPAKSEAYTIYKTTCQAPAFYPAFHPLMYSLDTFLPIVNFGQKDYWWPDATHDRQYHRKLPHPSTPLVRLASADAFHVSIRDDLREQSAGVVRSLVTSGSFLSWYRWLHIAAGWSLTTLAVAGFTGLVRKD